MSGVRRTGYDAGSTFLSTPGGSRPTVVVMTLTETLEAELLRARRSGDRAAAAALRTALTALLEAEAVAPADVEADTVQAQRREVPEAERRGLVRAEADDLLAAAAAYDGIDTSRAADARQGADLLLRVLAETD